MSGDKWEKSMIAYRHHRSVQLSYKRAAKTWWCCFLNIQHCMHLNPRVKLVCEAIPVSISGDKG